METWVGLIPYPLQIVGVDQVYQLPSLAGQLDQLGPLGGGIISGLWDSQCHEPSIKHLVGGLEHFLFSMLFGIVVPTD